MKIEQDKIEILFGVGMGTRLVSCFSIIYNKDFPTWKRLWQSNRGELMKEKLEKCLAATGSADLQAGKKRTHDWRDILKGRVLVKRPCV